MSEFRLFLTHICLLETKEIHSLLCIKFSRVFSNVYDKKCSVVIMQRNQDGSKLHCKLIRQRAPLPKSQTVTILTHQKLLKKSLKPAPNEFAELVLPL